AQWAAGARRRGLVGKRSIGAGPPPARVVGGQAVLAWVRIAPDGAARHVLTARRQPVWPADFGPGGNKV
ncbi:hypothetical protein, partial [Sphingomonas sp.]|uniref:hypothetical protein n=1 Tax=Sphingomonas sp. TaxID=28214 RepID=UPI003B3B05E5